MTTPPHPLSPSRLFSFNLILAFLIFKATQTFCSTSLPLARTRCVWSTFSSHCPLSSKQRHWLIFVTLIISPLKNLKNFMNAGNQNRGCWVRGKYATSVLCSPCKQYKLWLRLFWSIKDIKQSWAQLPSSLRHCFLETINENQKDLRFAPCLGNLLKKFWK